LGQITGSDPPRLDPRIKRIGADPGSAKAGRPPIDTRQEADTPGKDTASPVRTRFRDGSGAQAAGSQPWQRHDNATASARKMEPEIDSRPLLAQRRQHQRLSGRGEAKRLKGQGGDH